ncbi:MAG: V-type ATP synthase subunit I, partial [Candidatus Thiodiazotropha sp. 6PDIVS]
MFTPLPMKQISIKLLTEDLPGASVILAGLNSFSPDNRPYEEIALPEVPGQSFREQFNQAKSRLDKISSLVDYTPSHSTGEAVPITEEQLSEANQWLGEAWETCSDFEERQRQQTEESRNIDQLETSLANFSNLTIDLGQLQGDQPFLETSIGMIPTLRVTQLEDALGLDGYLLFPFMESEKESHVLIVGAKREQSSKLKSVLDSAGFRPL